MGLRSQLYTNCPALPRCVNAPSTRTSGLNLRRSPGIVASSAEHITNTALLQGRVRTKTVKRSAKVLIEKYYPKLTLDFETNKRLTSEIAQIQSKRLRNKIAGYTTHLMKRIQKGPVRGISFKLQEEERERKDQYVPEVSALDLAKNDGNLKVDEQTEAMLKDLGFKVDTEVVAVSANRTQRRFRK